MERQAVERANAANQGTDTKPVHTVVFVQCKSVKYAILGLQNWALGQTGTEAKDNTKTNLRFTVDATTKTWDEPASAVPATAKALVTVRWDFAGNAYRAHYRSCVDQGDSIRFTLKLTRGVTLGKKSKGWTYEVLGKEVIH